MRVFCGGTCRTDIRAASTNSLAAFAYSLLSKKVIAWVNVSRNAWIALASASEAMDGGVFGRGCSEKGPSLKGPVIAAGDNPLIEVTSANDPQDDDMSTLVVDWGEVTVSENGPGIGNGGTTGTGFTATFLKGTSDKDDDDGVSLSLSVNGPVCCSGCLLSTAKKLVVGVELLGDSCCC